MAESLTVRDGRLERKDGRGAAASKMLVAASPCHPLPASLFSSSFPESLVLLN
jgi:hypothetical protein